MTNETHFHKLENMYHGAPCNAYYEPQMSIREGEAELLIPIKPKLFHAARAAHGSVYFKAMDDSAFFAVSSLVEDVFVLTSTFNIYLTRPIDSGKMRAVGKVVSQTRTQFIAESVVYNDENKEIARGSGIFVKSKFPLSEDLGYR